ncbi:MAG: SDR family oxidoreductase [Longimicrobiales bacterium]
MNRYDDVCRRLRQNPRRWLVTGVAGFIGSHLLEALLRLDQHVVGVDNFATGYAANFEDAEERTRGTRGSFRLIEGDIRDPDLCLLACQEVDFVLHQAALGSVPRSIVDPMTYHQVNVDGFVNMIVAARDTGVRRFVYASSSAVYGDHPALPKVEAAIGEPVSPYGLTKRMDEEYGELFRRVYGVESVGLRYFNVFGRRQDPQSTYAAVIPQWVANLLRDDPCFIHGDGETTRDFCHVENVVQANVLAAVEPIGEGNQIYNVGCGDRTSLNLLFSLIRDGLALRRLELAGVQARYDEFRPGDVRHSQADIARIREALGYEPTHLLAAGLVEALGWYFEHLDPQPVAAA